MDLTTLAIAKKFSGNNSGGSSDSKIFRFQITPSNNTGDNLDNLFENSLPVPVAMNVSWNDLLEAYNNNFTLIPCLVGSGTGSMYFNLAAMVTQYNNSQVFYFSCSFGVSGSIIMMNLIIMENQAMLFSTTFSNGDGVSY